MPHKPNPIPRFNAATNPQSQYNFPSQSQPVNPAATPGARREHPTVPPRHRASSWTSQSSQSHEGAPPASSSGTGSRSGGNSGSGGGSRSGRSLPPPRFQRKQRPPRVQQALAAANNNSQHGSHPRSGGGRRDGGNNWNNAAINVPSLSMAAINAASARGSLLQLQQQLSNPPPVDPRSLEVMGFDEQGEDDYDDAALSGYEDLDPVQLHNQLSYGAAHPIDAASASTDSLPQFLHEPTLRQVLPSQDVFVPTYPPTTSQSSRNNTRLRSFSHNVPQGHVQQHPPLPNAQNPNTPSSVGAPSPYALSFGMQTPVTIDVAALEGEAQSRMRSRSLISPLESGGMLKSSQNHTFPDVPLPQMPAAVGGFEGPPTSERARNVSDAQSGPERPSLEYSNATVKKPLKSALKVRATDTRVADIFPGAPRSAALSNTPLSSHGQFPASATEQPPQSTQDAAAAAALLNPIPDAQFTLPDSLQAQYAHQLRLLQEEYASKAAKAERRQRSLGRGKPSPRSLNAVPIRPAGATLQPEDRGRDAGEKGLVDDGYVSWDDRWAEQDNGNKRIYNHPGLREGSENLPASISYGATTLEQSGSEDGRSDVGDRGHEDSTMRAHPAVHPAVHSSHDGDATNMANMDISPVGAIAHGHESSSSISSNALSNAGHDTRPGLPAQLHVEITAPTPVIPPADLEELVDHSLVVRPVPNHPQVVLSTYDTSARPNTTTSSEESVSTESNRTFTRVVSPTHPPLTPFDSSSTLRQDISDTRQEIILPPGLDVAKQALPSGEIAPRPSLQRLAQRISRGANPSPTQSPLSAPPMSVFVPQARPNVEVLGDRPQKAMVSSGQRASFDEDMDVVAHNLRNTSIHSSSPRSAASAQASFGPSLGRINEQPNFDAASPSDSFLSHSSILNFDAGSLSSYGARDRRSVSSVLSQNSQGAPYRSLRGVGISESSSAASVESGSSHAFTSASGHSHFLPKRVNVPSPIAGSTASSEGHHSSHSHISAPAFPSPIQRPLNPEDKLRHQGSSQSIGSIGSGKSAPATSAPKMSTVESIWTLGKDEASWPQAPPSSSGHSSSKNAASSFTLGALIPSTLLSEMDAPTPQEIELSLANDPLHDGVTSSTSQYPTPSTLSHDAPPFRPAFPPQPSSAPLSQLQGRPKQFTSGHQLHAAKSMPNIDANRAMAKAQAQAARIQQLRAEADAYDLPVPDLGRLHHQSSSSSLPLNHSVAQSMDRWNHPPMSAGGGMGSRAFGSVSSHATDSSSRTIMLPASGGVFPRFQEISLPPLDVAGRSGTNGGKLKSLFKPRDTRVFK